METKLIRVTKPDYDRITFMKGYLSITKFITSLLDEAEQPKVIEEVKKPVRKNPSFKEKPKAHPAFQKIQDIYIEHWNKNNGFEYKWNGVIDSTATNRLIKNIESRNEKDGDIVEFFMVLMDKLPEFYKNKSINAINKNLNGIISDIKTGGNKVSSLEEIRKHYGF